MGARLHNVVVSQLPNWIDLVRLLGVGDWSFTSSDDGRVRAEARLSTADAADVAARFRGLGLDGAAIEFSSRPVLGRDAIRTARTVDARRRWNTSPGFARAEVRLDDEGRMSLTPEALALKIAERFRAASVVDACCGAGGNCIAFARHGCHVTAVDTNRGRLEDAKHNARIYGVDHLIRFVEGDAREIVCQHSADVLFIDVPWGEQWNRVRTGSADLPLLGELVACARAASYKTILAKVPPSFSAMTIPGSRPQAVFGVATGDWSRIKFVLLELEGNGGNERR